MKKKGEYIFIEFKNGQFSENEKKFKEIEIPQLELKILGSLYILQELEKSSFEELRKITNYILVFNKEKNKHITTDSTMTSKIGMSDIGNSIMKFSKNSEKKAIIKFGLEKFKGYCFKNVHTYSKEEFEQKFVKKYEKY